MQFSKNDFSRTRNLGRDGRIVNLDTVDDNLWGDSLSASRKLCSRRFLFELFPQINLP